MTLMTNLTSRDKFNLLINRLRENKDKQITGKLCRIINDEPCYCVNGIAIEVAMENGLTVRKILDDMDCVRYNNSVSTISRTIYTWYSTKDKVFSLFNRLERLNDNNKLSFPQIADSLEKLLATNYIELIQD